MLNDINRLVPFTSKQPASPGFGMINSDEKGHLWASDGEVELYIPKSNAPKGKWGIEALPFSKIANAAGEGADYVLLDEEDTCILITKGGFSAKHPLAEEEATLPPMFDGLKPNSKACVIREIAHPKAFTEAFKCAATFASQGEVAAMYWMGVLLRNTYFYGSDQGHTLLRANTLEEKPFTENDILAPAKIAAKLSGNITKVYINNEMGLGAFQLEDGAYIVFRFIETPGVGYPDLEEAGIKKYVPEDGDVWSEIDENFSAAIQQVGVVCNDEYPAISLKHDDDSPWYLYAHGNGEVSIDLNDFDLKGNDIILKQEHWISLLNVAAELASVEMGVAFRGELDAGDGTFDVCGIITSCNEG